MMLQDAQKQIANINVSQIKDVLKKLIPDKFDNMIVDINQKVKRGDYVFINFKYQIADRSLKSIKFPLYGSIKDNFSALEGGESKFGIKSSIKSNQIFELLETNYQIKGTDFASKMITNGFDYPFDLSNNDISQLQSRYFFPDLTYQEACSNCTGNKYIKCTDRECNGRHEYACPTCNGDKKVICRICNKAGVVQCSKCTGRGEYKCSKCGGKGEITCGWSGCSGKGFTMNGNKQVRCAKCSGRGFTPCSECRSGIIKCEVCSTKGVVRCTNCSGSGEVNCSYCNASGRIICKTCYGDKSRYGMVDCPICKTMGQMAQIVYVDTIIENHNRDKILNQGEQINITDNQIIQHVKFECQSEVVYKNVNQKIIENYDDYSRLFTDLLEKELGLSKTSFPLLLNETIFYQIIPCIEISYKHILTNTIHELSIINFFKNPEIIIHNNPEKLGINIGNAVKVVGGLFGKIFKTKGFKSKEDKRTEIILLIHLMRVDGEVTEEEKLYVSNLIGNLEEFTNSEKEKMFALLHIEVLPELTNNDVIFSSNEREIEVVNNIIELANSDGEVHSKEMKLIETIKQLISKREK